MMPRRQLFIFGALFLAIVTLLAIIYVAFLRANYIPLFENLRESDASAIVEELDKQGIGYQLGNDGHDIMVAEQDVGPARLALAGSGVALGGVVGFELFNESDMGLTEFAQKINYQRALQGELARTIMMMDGVEFARVHLALPEKSIFRAAQTQPTAAVTVQTVGKIELGPERVAGIQQLVASAVTDLPIGNVAILNDRGDLLNQVANPGTASGATADEKTALEQYFRARAQAAIAQHIPGLRSEIKVFASKIVDTPSDAKTPSAEAEAPAEEAAPAAAPSSGNRDFHMRVVVRTAAAVSDEDSDILRNAIIEALPLKTDAGDSITFEVGPLGFMPGQAVPLKPYDATQGQPGNNATPPLSRTSNGRTDWMAYVFNRWFLLLFLIAGIVATLLWRQRGRLNDEELQSFADMLSDGLSSRQAARHAE